MQLTLVSCCLSPSNDSIIAEIRTAQKTSPTLADILGIRQINDIIATLSPRPWQRLDFSEPTIANNGKRLLNVILPVSTKVVPFEELRFEGLHYRDDNNLLATTREAAAKIGATHAVENDIAALHVLYQNKAGEEKRVKIVNYNVYKALRPDDKKVERFVDRTGCLLLK